MSTQTFVTALHRPFLRLGWVCLAFLLPGAAPRAAAEEISVELRLIWGTNEEKSQKTEHKPVDAETASKLQKIFKWKNYFLETNVVQVIPHRQSKKLEMSRDCIVEIQEMEGAPVEVKLFGKGKLINRTTKPLHRGEWIVIGGDDKNECAWFVILNRQ
jgi:hypothetical protein